MSFNLPLFPLTLNLLLVTFCDCLTIHISSYCVWTVLNWMIRHIWTICHIWMRVSCYLCHLKLDELNLRYELALSEDPATSLIRKLNHFIQNWHVANSWNMPILGGSKMTGFVLMLGRSTTSSRPSVTLRTR